MESPIKSYCRVGVRSTFRDSWDDGMRGCIFVTVVKLL